MDKTQSELQTILADDIFGGIREILWGYPEITLQTVLNALEDVKADVGDLIND